MTKVEGDAVVEGAGSNAQQRLHTKTDVQIEALKQDQGNSTNGSVAVMAEVRANRFALGAVS